MRQAPHAVPSLLGALEEFLVPPQLVVLRGPAANVMAWQRELATRFAPHTLVFALPNDTDGLPAGLAHPASEHAAAYVCIGTSCLPPISNLDELNVTLASRVIER